MKLISPEREISTLQVLEIHHIYHRKVKFERKRINVLINSSDDKNVL